MALVFASRIFKAGRKKQFSTYSVDEVNLMHGEAFLKKLSI